MDYKYIEQLLERYWACQTSEQEEDILRAFFSQDNVPAELARYKALFAYQRQQASLHLGSDFDKKVLAAAGQISVPPIAEHKTVKVKHITLTHRLQPLFRAAAVVAIVTLVGITAQRTFNNPSATEPAQGWDYSQEAYKDSYSDPNKAHEATMKALEMFKKGPQTASVDSARNKTLKRELQTKGEE